MTLPDLVRGELGDEDPVARVHLGGDDELFVTPTRTLVYRADGLLSDESVEEHPHDAERVSVSESRRKAKFVLEYGLDGERSFAVPLGKADEVLHPVLAGVLSAAGVTEPGETVERTFRFSELTLVVTSARLVKHVGAAVWDDDSEEFRYEDVTDLGFEEGSVATTLVLTAAGRRERFKAPSDRAREVKESLVDALLSYYGVASLDEFRALAADADGEGEADATAIDRTDFGDGPDPLSADPAEVDEHEGTRGAPRVEPAGPEGADEADGPGAAAGADGATAAGAAPATAPEAGRDAGRGAVSADAASADGIAAGAGAAEADTVDAAVADADAADADTTDADGAGADRESEDNGLAEAGFEPAAPADDVAGEVAALRETVERQAAQLERQNELVERLIVELRRGR